MLTSIDLPNDKRVITQEIKAARNN